MVGAVEGEGGDVGGWRGMPGQGGKRWVGDGMAYPYGGQELHSFLYF